MRQQNIIKPATPKKLQTIMNKIGLKNQTLDDHQVENIINNFNRGDITVTEKNQLLISIISKQIKTGAKRLDGFDMKNSCKACNGKGFNIFLQLELNDKCKGTHDCLPCNGNGIMTKTCIRCHGITLNETLKIRKIIIDYKSGLIKNIPDMNKEDGMLFLEEFDHYSEINIKYINEEFLSKNGEKTFRVIQTDSVNSGNNKIYVYIQPNQCSACGGTGRFVYTTKERTIKCPGCHGKGVVKKHLTSTNIIKYISVCTKCNGNGKTFSDNPVLNIKHVKPEIRAELENRGLLKK